MSEFVHVEKDVAETLGVARKVLKDIRDRKMYRGEDFELVSSRICLSERGLELVVREIEGGKEKRAPESPQEASEPEGDTESEAPAESGEEDTPGEAVTEDLGYLRKRLPAYTTTRGEVVGTVKAEYKNKHILGVDVDGTLVRLRVKNAWRFEPGMVVPMRLIREPDLYELTRREPRRRGRW